MLDRGHSSEGDAGADDNDINGSDTLIGSVAIGPDSESDVDGNNIDGDGNALIGFAAGGGEADVNENLIDVGENLMTSIALGEDSEATVDNNEVSGNEKYYWLRGFLGRRCRC